jgi:hydrogenase nickel incorporation protein HypA/HybF
MNIIQIATAEAEGAKARLVNSVEIDLGRLAGVETASLEFCFQTARNDTPLAGAELVIHDIPGRGHCAACDTTHDVDFFVAICPDCSGPLEITTGRELKVRSINID